MDRNEERRALAELDAAISRVANELKKNDLEAAARHRLQRELLTLIESHREIKKRIKGSN